MQTTSGSSGSRSSSSGVLRASREDVTDEIPELLADRIPEFLAILVHHVLAGQTLDPDSADFRTRARRLQQLRVMSVENLVIEARVKGTDESTTIGEHSEEELFLEGEATPNPVIYHDLKGDRLARRVPPAAGAAYRPNHRAPRLRRRLRAVPAR